MVVRISVRYADEVATVFVYGKGSTGKRGKRRQAGIASGKVLGLIQAMVQELAAELEPA